MPESYVLQLVGNDTMTEMCDMIRTLPAGNVVEVGVYQGGSALWLSRVCEEQQRELWLYDTFEGIPYQGPDDSHKVGDFGDTDEEKVSRMIPRARVVKGVFPSSMQEMGPIAFAHIDVDQYESYRGCLTALVPLMVPGGVMWFDDVGCLEGANRAVREWGHPIEMAKCGKVYARF